jgi:hypothetical protein
MKKQLMMATVLFVKTTKDKAIKRKPSLVWELTKITLRTLVVGYIIGICGGRRRPGPGSGGAPTDNSPATITNSSLSEEEISKLLTSRLGPKAAKIVQFLIKTIGF